VAVTDTRRVVTHPCPPGQVRDARLGNPLNTPVPVPLVPTLGPRVMSVPRPWLPRDIPLTRQPVPTPVEVRPLGAEVSGMPETKAPRPADWVQQTNEAVASGELRPSSANVPSWAAVGPGPHSTNDMLLSW